MCGRNDTLRTGVSNLQRIGHTMSAGAFVFEECTQHCLQNNQSRLCMGCKLESTTVPQFWRTISSAIRSQKPPKLFGSYINERRQGQQPAIQITASKWTNAKSPIGNLYLAKIVRMDSLILRATKSQRLQFDRPGHAGIEVLCACAGGMIRCELESATFSE